MRTHNLSQPRRTKGRTFAVGLVMLVLLVLAGGDVRAEEKAAPPSRLVDTPSPAVLMIGAHTVSHQSLEMNLQRFTGARLQQERPASPEEIRRWFEEYLVQQVIVAEAYAQGFDRRTEVTEAVERMERHMLTQVEGPLYQTLLGNPAVSPERIGELYAQGGKVPSIVAARMPNARAALLDAAEWLASTDDQRTEILRRLDQEEGVATFFRGTLPWPFDAVPELDELLVDAELGKWLRQKAGGLTTVVLVRASETPDRPSLEEMGGSFSRFACHNERLRLRRERVARTLMATEFVAFDDVALRLAALLRGLPSPDVEIPPAAFAAVESEVLAEYRDCGQLARITVGQWLRYYNRLYLRSIPRTAAAVMLSVQDLVATEYDLREARARGLDRTPQFVENRNTFRALQVLDLFERETLLPTIVVSEAEIHEHFDARRAEYSRPVGARGRVHEFADAAAARKWLRSQSPTAGSETWFGSRSVGREVVVTADRPLLGAAGATNILLNLPDGRCFGPVSRAGGGVILFQKAETQRQVRPLEEVARSIQERIAREKLLVEEWRLAAEWCRHLAVRDAIPYEALGLTTLPGRPWQPDGVPVAGATETPLGR